MSEKRPRGRPVRHEIYKCVRFSWPVYAWVFGHKKPGEAIYDTMSRLLGIPDSFIKELKSRMPGNMQETIEKHKKKESEK